MNCPKCNSVNSNDSKFCIICGAELSQATKICPNGHIYDAKYDVCPICPSPELAQKIGSAIHSSPTVAYSDNLDESMKNTVVEQVNVSGEAKGSKKTVIVNEPSKDGIKEEIRQSRKLAGWLITFTWSAEGEDYRLYEGRNLITGGGQGDIIISDPAVSNPHCMILFRSGRFKIKDELSTNGTFINGTEIEETELKDSDIIKIGTTELKLRTVN
ncbi:MAG: FHA domain-containing protein [Ignavibacteria bacterium]|nr:FHA domain-containing protein [Ignavibacteria bacterium]